MVPAAEPVWREREEETGRRAGLARDFHLHDHHHHLFLPGVGAEGVEVAHEAVSAAPVEERQSRVVVVAEG
jgi:hypothetical protein